MKQTQEKNSPASLAPMDPLCWHIKKAMCSRKWNLNDPFFILLSIFHRSYEHYSTKKIGSSKYTLKNSIWPAFIKQKTIWKKLCTAWRATEIKAVWPLKPCSKNIIEHIIWNVVFLVNQKRYKSQTLFWAKILEIWRPINLSICSFFTAKSDIHVLLPN